MNIRWEINNIIASHNTIFSILGFRLSSKNKLLNKLFIWMSDKLGSFIHKCQLIFWPGKQFGQISWYINDTIKMLNNFIELTKCIACLLTYSPCEFHSVATAKARGSLGTRKMFPWGVLNFLLSKLISYQPKQRIKIIDKIIVKEYLLKPNKSKIGITKKNV